jgi:hypothetical protein
MNFPRVLLVMMAAAAQASVETPIIGCFVEGEQAHEVVGIGGNFILRDAESCPVVENRWSIETGADGNWHSRRDPASGAIEHLEKLRDGQFLAWPDGKLTDIDSLELPAPMKSARLMSPDWYRIVLDDGDPNDSPASIALARNGLWFFLPGAPQ